jgi:RNase P/RNase MRP subunit p30
VRSERGIFREVLEKKSCLSSFRSVWRWDRSRIFESCIAKSLLECDDLLDVVNLVKFDILARL